MRQLAEGAGLGLARYYYRPQRGVAYLSPVLSDLLGYSPDDFYRDPDLGVRLAHPDDLTLISNLTHGLTLPEQSVLRLRRRDGQYAWLDVRCLPILDANGDVCGFDALAIDVTLQQESERSRAAIDAQFQAIFAEAPVGIALLDRAGRIQESNRAFGEILGYSTAELREAGFPRLTHPDDLATEARLFWELAAGQRSRYQIEKRLYHRSGRLIWARTSVARQTASTGSSTFAIALLEDITDRKQAEATARHEDERALWRETFLAEVSKRLADSLDFQTTLISIAKLVVPEFGDWSVIDVVTPNESIRRVAVAYSDPDQDSLAREIQDWQPPVPAEAGGINDVARGGTAILYREMSDEALDREINLLASRDVIQRAGITSIIAVPIRIHDRILGALTLAGLASRPRYHADDLRLAEEVANRAALAIESARAYQAEQHARAVAEEGERRSAYLAEVSSLLSASLDYETTLENLARLSVPAFADWCSVELLEGADTIHRVAVACADPTWSAFAQSQRRRFPLDAPDVAGSIAVLRSGQSIKLSRLRPEAIERLTADSAYAAFLRELGLRSILVVPIRAGNHILGVLSLATAESHRDFGAADQRFAEEIARRIALAVENARLYRAAREAVQAREEFMAVAAHELKTPVTGLRLAAQVAVRRLLAEFAPDPDKLRLALITIDQQSHKLAILIEQLLDVARIEAGRLALSPEETNLTALVRDVITAAEGHPGGHEITFESTTPVFARVDPLRFEQVITNLLDNARKYSPVDRPIEVKLEERPGHSSPAQIELSVRDWGNGVRPEHRAYIFDRFYQAEQGTHATGMGLGLYVSRQIIELHRGTIRAEFPSDGGSRFIITLRRDQGP